MTNIETNTAIVKAEVDSAAEDPSSLNKFTAALVQEDCPKLLRDLHKQIAAHLEKAGKYAEKADQHRISAGRLFVQVQEHCDEGGFAAFHEKFFPNMGRSRTYELLAIGTGKKSGDETRASTRERVARYRAKAALSVTVTDDSASPKKVEDGEDPSITQRGTEHTVLFAESSDSAAADGVEQLDDHAGQPSHAGDQAGALGVKTVLPAESAVTPAPASNPKDAVWQLIEAIDRVYELGQEDPVGATAEALTQTGKKKIQKCLRELAGILRTLRDEIAKSTNIMSAGPIDSIGRKLTCSADVDAVLKNWRRRPPHELSHLALAIRRAAGRGLHLCERQWRAIHEIEATARDWRI